MDRPENAGGPGLENRGSGVGHVESRQLEDSAERQEVLKGIIRGLHAGEDMEALKTRFRELIRDVDPSEIAAMEQALMDEGMPQEEVKRLCDVHVAIFKDALDGQAAPSVPEGHPIHSFMMENRQAEAICAEIQSVMQHIGAPPDEGLFKSLRNELLEWVNRLSEIDLHYLRKENQLFPLLEAQGVSGPSQVMWAIHDDIRSAIKRIREELSGSASMAILDDIRMVLEAVRDMIYKEENILFPMSLKTLSEAQWAQVRQGEEEIGHAWIRSPQQWRPPPKSASVPEQRVAAAEQAVNLQVGALSRNLLNLTLTHLPVDITVVDKDDRVAYYSQGKERIFPRSPAIIGREVRKCHPPKSVHMVDKILDAFKSGKRDVAEFWIQLGERFIHIRYFALRSEDGAYEGTMEVSQDVTGIRRLEGQRRLLDWE